MTKISNLIILNNNNFINNSDNLSDFSSNLNQKPDYKIAGVAEGIKAVTTIMRSQAPLIKKSLSNSSKYAKPASLLKNQLPTSSGISQPNSWKLNLNNSLESVRRQLQIKYESKQEAENIGCNVTLTEAPDSRSEDHIPAGHPDSKLFSPATRRQFKYTVTATAIGMHDGMPAVKTTAKLLYKKSSPIGTELKPYGAIGTTIASKTAQYTTDDIDYLPNAARPQKKFELITVTGKAQCTWADGTKLEAVKNVLHE